MRGPVHFRSIRSDLFGVQAVQLRRAAGSAPIPIAVSQRLAYPVFPSPQQTISNPLQPLEVSSCVCPPIEFDRSIAASHESTGSFVAPRIKAAESHPSTSNEFLT